MPDAINRLEAPAVDASSARTGLASCVAALAGRLSGSALPTGEHAALRRMDPAAPGRAALTLYRLLADAGIDTSGPESEKRWALVVHALALARGRHDRTRRIGAVLAEIGVSEARLNTLLAADFDVLLDLVPRLARRLDASGASADWLPLVRLVLSTGYASQEEQADEARLTIARAFARAADSTKT